LRSPVAALLLAPAIIILGALLIAPLGDLFSYGLLATGAGPRPHPGFTLANFSKLLGDAFYLGIFARTLLLSALATAIAALAGTIFALFMWRAPARWRPLLTVLILSPLLVSVVVTSYGWMVILGTHGAVNQALLALGLITAPLKLIFNDVGIVVGLVHVVIPFVVLSVLAALERIDPALLDAAATLGASRLRMLLRVVLPLALPGISAGTVIVFCLCISSYVTPAMLGGNGPNFIATLIFDQFVSLYNWPFGAAIATLLLAISVLIVLLYLRLLARPGHAA
jgi:putative spermidine/putrescine transport system permease protein